MSYALLDASHNNEDQFSNFKKNFEPHLIENSLMLHIVLNFVFYSDF